MVSLWRASRRGGSSFGCLLSLLLFAGALYHGVNFKITRGGRPNLIVIETEYTDQVNLPLFKHTFVLRPRAEEAL